MARRRLRQSAERLVRLLELQAPETIVANEVALLLRQGLCSLPDLGDFLGRWMTGRARVQGGLCVQCGERDVATPERELCVQCAAQEDAEQRDAEQGGQQLCLLEQELLGSLEESLARRQREEERWLAGADAEVGQ